MRRSQRPPDLLGTLESCDAIARATPSRVYAPWAGWGRSGAGRD
jgi:hypothetical protein